MKILFKRSAYKRLKVIRKKQAIRKERVREAFAYLSKWSDIPMRELWGSVCDILHIEKNKAAYDLCFRMCMDLREEDVVKLIPLQ